MLSTAIMAHPSRARFVIELLPQLGDVEVVWDRCDDRWDTGRRAVLAYNSDADWHVVVQDDAILCTNFLAGVERALASVPPDVPVSFYTGKTRPYGNAIRKGVAEAQKSALHWLALRGPLWGVAVALPTSRIDEMVADCDDLEIPNYDMRMSEWFHTRKIPCWYSIPSLVDHRVGPENPSLIQGRGSSPARTAWLFLGDAYDPQTINWATDAHFLGDPSEPWTEDWQCTRCLKQSESLAVAVVHASRDHDIGPIDLFASTPHHAKTLAKLRDQLPPDVMGTLYFLDRGKHGSKLGAVRVRPGSALKQMSGAEFFTIVGARRDFKYIKSRPAWSLDGAAT